MMMDRCLTDDLPKVAIQPAQDFSMPIDAETALPGIGKQSSRRRPDTCRKIRHSTKTVGASSELGRPEEAHPEKLPMLRLEIA